MMKKESEYIEKEKAYERLCLCAKEIFEKFNCNVETVYLDINMDENYDIKCGRVNDGRYEITIGVKDLVTKDITKDILASYKNSVFHELVHARNYFCQSNEIREMYNNYEKSYAYWAYKLVEEYIAYKEAYEFCEESGGFLKSTESEILTVFEHYCNRLNGVDHIKDFEFFDSYYDLGSAFIAHKFGNKEFPSIHNENYIKFIEKYFYHLEKAVNNNYTMRKEYEQLGRDLLRDFEILYRVVKKKHPQSSFDWFKVNSHMK